MEQVMLTCQRGGHHGSRNTSWEEETRERLSSLIRQKGLTGGGRDDCYWVLLADSSRDRFVILEGIHESCCLAACNHDFRLVAVGSAAAASESEDDGCCRRLFWPEAKDLACVLHKIMRKKRNDAAKDSEILQESAIRGLLIYHQVGCEAEARFTRAEDEFIPPSSVASSIPSLELEMQMLSRVLKPPSVLAAAASPSLLARGHLDNTASSSSSTPPPLANNPSEAAGYEQLSELPMIMTAAAGDTYTGGNMNMIMATAGDGNSALGHSLLLVNLVQELAAAPPHFITRSSGGRGRNGGDVVVVPANAIEFLVRRLWPDYDLEAQRRPEIFPADSNLAAHLLPAATAAAADGAGRTGGGAVAPVREPSSDVSKMLKVFLVQALIAFLPACVTAYSQLKDAPDYVKLTTFGGLAFITVGLYVGILSRSVPRRKMVFRLVVFSAIALLTFSSAASLFPSPTSITVAAAVGVALNLIVMLLRF